MDKSNDDLNIYLQTLLYMSYTGAPLQEAYNAVKTLAYDDSNFNMYKQLILKYNMILILFSTFIILGLSILLLICFTIHRKFNEMIGVVLTCNK